MLASRYRFHGHRSVRATMTNGQVRRGRMTIVRYQDTPHRPLSRCAVIVSKKTLKSAVKRNRVRRRIYNIVRHELESLSQPYSIVIVVVSPDAISAPHAELTAEISRLLSPLVRVADRS